MDRVADAVPLMEDGLKLATAPAGRPVAAKVVDPAKPFDPETVTVYLAVPPAVTVCELGEAETEKSGAALVQARSALFAFKRPPVTVLPVREDSKSTLFRMVDLSAAFPRLQTESTSAAAPET